MAAPYTPAGCRHGARLCLPLTPGLLVFGAAFGTAAAQKGLSLWEAVGLSAFVFAGAAQMVALELWREVWTPSTLLGIAVLTATINARMILMGASVQPWMRGAPLAPTALTLFLFTDASWLIGTRYQAERGNDLGVLLGAGVALWVLWVVSTVPGYLAGSLVTNPRAWGLDLVMPIFFAIMLVPLWRGMSRALPWAVAGVVALAVQALVPGYAYIVAGALAGAAVEALRDG
ncbi:AzlC family ABC transporter permease [Salinarimonas soli]|nr:AzlC family ABC transporter permease [Salinarimonas soli]